MRRYDIDWLRVIAIGLLLIYHVAIAFQPWGVMIGFIANQKPWAALWTPMMMLNTWRIPLLFFVSGMGVYFAMHKRNWKQLITERANRILMPFLFGMFVIVPAHIFIWRYHYNMKLLYTWSPGHLWFLGNIFLYVLLLSPILFYLKRHEEGVVVRVIRKTLSHPLGLLVVAFVFILEVMLVKPVPFELYAMTRHGFILGMLAFFFGFCFVLSGQAFWQMLQRWRWVFITLGFGLFLLRLYYFGMNTPGYAVATESLAWVLAILAFGSRYLNKPGKVLSYLSEAAYPVYMVHMIFLYLGSHIIFQWSVPAPVQFVLLLVFTLTGCLGAVEVIRRVKWLRPLFGLKGT
ncbi:MAG: acyltransferase [Cyclobacteriaceae bacterium]|nr:acyltransferase [Cyclobacteriaceae bacterium]